MKLLTKSLEKKLLANGKLDEIAIAKDGNTPDHKPVVKFFGGSSCTWLITALYDDGRMYGLCDLGSGSPELGYIDYAELQTLRFKPFNLRVERDLHFTAEKTLSEYARDARVKGRIDA